MKYFVPLGLQDRLVLLLLIGFAALGGMSVVQSLHERDHLVQVTTADLLGHARLIAVGHQVITARSEAIQPGFAEKLLRVRGLQSPPGEVRARRSLAAPGVQGGT